MDVETVADGIDHPECVIASPEGMLFAGTESGDILRIEPDTGVRVVVASTGGFILGMALDGAGNLYVCDGPAVLRVDPRTGTVVPYSRGAAERLMRTPNFPVFDRHGALFVSDSGAWGEEDGCIFRIDVDGTTEVWSDDARGFPNGMALDAAGRELLIVESIPPLISAIAIEDDGSAGVRRVIRTLAGTVPDGIAVDVEGGLLVSCYRPDRILRLSGEGDVTVIADDPAGTALAAPTNIAFGGPNLTDLYIANFARWHVARLSGVTAGIPLEHPVL